MVTVSSIVEKLALYLNMGATGFHQNRTRNVIIDLPIEYIRLLISEWLQLKQWALLDSAFCSKGRRRELLGILESSLVSHNHHSSSHCFRWTVLRHIRHRRALLDCKDVCAVEYSYCKSQESKKHFLGELESIELVLRHRNHCWRGVLPALIENCHRLERLYISGNRAFYSRLVASLLKTHPSLTKLNLDQANILRLADGLLSLKKLRRLSILRSAAQELNTILEVCRNNSQLTCITLQSGKFSRIELWDTTLQLRIVRLTPSLLEAFRHQCFTLTELYIYKCVVTAEALDWICSKARTSLMVLNIRRCVVTAQAKDVMEALRRRGVAVIVRD